jgi:hypothetical protein
MLPTWHLLVAAAALGLPLSAQSLSRPQTGSRPPSPPLSYVDSSLGLHAIALDTPTWSASATTARPSSTPRSTA